MSICIIIPYFGKFPSYFDLYLQSCSHNPNIHILFFTDNPPPQSYPKNVYFIHMSLKELKTKFEAKLNMKVALVHPYKLCDLRGAYGLVLSKYIEAYDFWGFGDIDLVYGDLAQYIHDELLNKYDIISLRKYWLSGSLTLMKNKNYNNHIFKTRGDYKIAFSNAQHFSFAECRRLYKNLIAGKDILNIPTSPLSMTHFVRQAVKEEKLTAFFEDGIIKESIPKGHIIRYNKGVVEEYKLGNLSKPIREYAYYHFITEKRLFCFSYPSWKHTPNDYYISPTGFYLPEQMKYYYLIHYSRIVFTLPKLIISFLHRVKNKIKRTLSAG